MAQRELHEHRGYLADERRIEAYRAALAEVIRPGDVVLDLGCGTGLLGYLACEAGAERVVAVDRGDIIGLARRIAADNGYADRITHQQALSTELNLDTSIDVVVCDQIGGLVHDAGILSCFADARRRLLAPDGRLVPSAFRIFTAPVTFELGRTNIEFWSSKPAAFDVSAARAVAANTEGKYNVVAEDMVGLAEAVELASFASDHEDGLRGSADFMVDQAGRLDGFVGWFEAQMSPSVTLTNHPWSPDRFDRWCNFYPLDLAVDVQPGDQVHLDLDVRPRLEVVSWSTAIVDGAGRRQQMRQSSFAGSFLTGTTVDAAAQDGPVSASDRVTLLRTVLGLVDGARSQADIVTTLADQVGPEGPFVSQAHLERFVRDVVALAR